MTKRPSKIRLQGDKDWLPVIGVYLPDTGPERYVVAHTDDTDDTLSEIPVHPAKAWEGDEWVPVTPYLPEWWRQKNVLTSREGVTRETSPDTQPTGA